MKPAMKEYSQGNTASVDRQGRPEFASKKKKASKPRPFKKPAAAMPPMGGMQVGM